MVDLRAWDRARVLGAVEEAETLGCDAVGTEHLLLATLAEPTVGWAFRTVGVDRAEVQSEALRIGGRPRGAPSSLLTEEAEEELRSRHVVDVLDTDEPAEDEVARALRLLAARFLCRSRRSVARDVLDGLGILRVRSRVIATIEHNTRRSGAAHPVSTGAHPNASRRDHRPALRLLDQRPGPTSSPF